eukprot:m.481607 g.481607  ORF g.481607 m.481607 type:complete len:81 (-) comp21717_c0_seq7:1898-2140(-)
MAGFGGGIAGLGPTNAVFEPAAWVDKSKQPGHTSTAPRTGQVMSAYAVCIFCVVLLEHVDNGAHQDSYTYLCRHPMFMAW